MKRHVGLGFALAWVVSSGLIATAAAATPECMGKRATIVGTGDDDRLRGTSGVDVIVGRGGNDELMGRGGNDVICGNGGFDRLVGGGGNDKLDAGRGWGDSLDGGPGDDLLDGGGGYFDDLDFRAAPNAVVVDLVAGTATGDGSDRIRGADMIIGSAFDDTLRGDDDPMGNWLVGMDGNDTLEAGAGDFEMLTGGNGDDVMDGGDGFDYLHNVTDLAGVDVDTGITVDLQSGTMTGQGDDTLMDVEGSTGTFGDDVLIGDANDNEFSTVLDGDDVVTGGPGNDNIDGGHGSDQLDGGPGTDTLWNFTTDFPLVIDLAAETGTGDGTDTLVGFENVVGSGQADVISGDDGANKLEGDPDWMEGAPDTIDGRGGDDTILGWGGDDVADGGDGTDACDAEEESACESDPATLRARYAQRRW